MRFKTIWSNTRIEIRVKVIDTKTNDEYVEAIARTDVWLGDEMSIITILELNSELFKERQLKKA